MLLSLAILSLAATVLATGTVRGGACLDEEDEDECASHERLFPVLPLM
ncbi:hypothetical protein [Caldimonas tepidiphila]|nr:hypothetical protein [Caldimonas tepidiphila]